MRHRAVLAGLALILAVAAWLRLSNVNWDANQHLHPDERFLTMVLAAERWPSSVAEYLNEATSPLNPRNVGFATFVYGALPVTLAKGLSLATGWTDYNRTVLVGRALSASADIGTVLLVFLTTLVLYRDRRGALLAAWLYGLSVLPIQHAHFFVVDSFATFFLAVATFGLARGWAVRRGPHPASSTDDVIAGVALGLALACKISAASFGALVALVVLAREGFRSRRQLASSARAFAIVGATALVAFRLAEPDAFSGAFGVSSRWWNNMVEAGQLVSGEVDFPPGAQWAARTPFWFPWLNMVLWGLGPALGLAAWTSWLAAAWQWLAHRDWRPAIPVAWVAVVFLLHGGGFVMTGRYFLPIYPALAIVAAWGLIGAWDAARARGVVARTTAAAVVAVVVAATALWAVAFTSIYRRPNTRVEASAWIYASVPAGAAIAVEHWDDALPLALRGVGTSARYRMLTLANYDEDTPEKLERLVATLERADCLVLASNRLYDSIPRLPMRYPMTVRYYAALFDGRLGFARAADFTSFPGLGPWRVDDRSAEEAFSVYDHARVQVFLKTSAWRADRARALLGDGIDWTTVVRLPPVRAARYKNGLVLTDARAAEARSTGTWSELFDPSGPANRRPVAVWCLVLVLIGVVAHPLAWATLPWLADRGWLVSRAIGLLVVAYGAWLMASVALMPFGRGSVVLVMLLVGLASAVTVWRQRKALGIWWRANLTLVLKEETVFWLAFAAFLLIRRSMPELWHPFFGGEKPMDFAYLNAVVKSASFPPYDPWFAGGYINYYYFGFVMSAVLVLLTGVVPSIAYNLLVPTFFALTVAGAFTATHTLAGALVGTERDRPLRWWEPSAFAYGVLGVVLLAVLGNLVEARMLTAERGREVPNWWWYWNPTRAIPAAAGEAPPITEFPFFTFLYGDLHAHMMALPYALLVLGVSVGLAIERPPLLRTRPALALVALTTGALYATNAWDYPAYTLIACAAIFWAAPGHTWNTGLKAVVPGIVAVVIGGRLLFWPFHQHFSAPSGAPALWHGSRTPIDTYLSIHGVFLFILGSSLVAWIRARDAGPLDARARRARWAVALLAGLGLALTLLVEAVTVDPVLGRMNMVFKFYFQVWTLWAVASGAALALLIPRWRPTWGRLAWAAAFGLLLASAAAYPVVATRARIADRFAPDTTPSLDGEAYMTTATHTELDRPFELTWDLDAIRWLRAHVRGSPVVAEAHMPEYRWGSRVSVYTGLPTIVGWSWHERQQRAVAPDLVVRRIADVHTIFSDPDPARAAALLDRYHVRYVYVGPLERIRYPSAGLAKFERDPERWRVVYENAQVKVYEVVLGS
jgi:uncharacterized membrane protein/4-amino-4-deoxy-L-arabinose transferase-like glycosyltransferase